MSKRIIQRRYCDKAMAMSMGIIGKRETNMSRCCKDCVKCMACVEVDTNGDKEHVDARSD